MKFKSITLENFGPYQGRQTVDLSTSDSAPVILVHGENMRGKTTLFHAIRWALYGKVKSHSGHEIQVTDFANIDLRDAGVPFTVGATLDFEDRGIEYTLTRTHICAQDPTEKSKVIEQSANLSLKTGDLGPIPQQDIRERINSILHEEISDLFLFDGETLSAFEQKLRSPAVSSGFIRANIEKALGLQSITRVIEDLESIKQKLSGERKRELASQKTANETISNLERKESELKTAEDDLLKMQTLFESANVNKARLQPYIDSSATLREKYEYREHLLSEISEAEREVRMNKNNIRDLLQKQFWAPATSTIRKRRDEIEIKIDALRSENFSISSDLSRINDLIKTLDTNQCIVCSQKVGAELHAKLKEQVNSFKSNEQLEKDNQFLLHSFTSTLKELREFSEAENTLMRIQELGTSTMATQVRIDSKKSQVADLIRTLDGVETDFDQIDREYSAAIAIIVGTEENIPKVMESIEQIRKEIKALNATLTDLKGVNAELAGRIQAVEILIEVFSASIDKFSDRMRKEVEISASNIFKKLTSEPEYAGLRINQNYYLEIIDKDDRVISRRSAGAEQVVAMSLIGGLVECSVRDAPVVIDTPLGRLDDAHRKNILSWLPDLGSQIILLVTSTEFRESQDRAYLGDRIGREYSLRRISEVHTEVERYKNG
jgi:DNA sulfur modification protein DndD